MLQETVVYLLSNVPGLPPIVQTVHLLGIAVIMSSVVLLDLRILGLALPSQDVQELTRRVMPFVWWTLPVMLLSGLPFVIQTAVVMPVVLALAYGIALVLDGALGNGIRLLRRARHEREDSE